MLGRLDVTMQGPPIGQAVNREIIEGQLLKLTVKALDADLAAATPSSARYRIDNLSTGTSTLGWTTLSPSTSMSILVTAAQNARSSCYSRERRQIVIEASDSDGPIRESVDYDLLDLQGT